MIKILKHVIIWIISSLNKIMNNDDYCAAIGCLTVDNSFWDELNIYRRETYVYNQWKYFEMLTEAECLINEQNVNKEILSKCFYTACKKDQTDVALELLKHRKFINLNLAKKKSTPFHHVCLRGNMGIAKVLFEYDDFDPNFSDPDNETHPPICYVWSRLKNLEFIEFLLKTGKVEFRYTGNNNSHLFYWVIYGGQIGLIRWFLDNFQVDINHLSKSNFSFLHRAVYCRNNIPIIKLLMENSDLDPNTIDMNEEENDCPGESPLMSAIRKHDFSAIELLLKHPKINLELTNRKSKTALDYAIRHNAGAKIVKLLKSRG